MIYNCWNCGWSINKRYGNNEIDPKDVGKYLLYDHKTFCSDYCIDSFKSLKTKPDVCPVADSCESGDGYCDHPEHYNVGWKKARKMKMK